MNEILLFTRRNDSSMKQADFRDIFKIGLGVLVHQPDPLSLNL